MFSHDFLTMMARKHELSLEQEQVLVMRVGEEKSYEQIAQQLNTSADACLKRMGQVYKKFNIVGNSRGKENKLRIFLSNNLKSPISEKSNLNSPVVIPTSVVQNLPAREYTAFVGRDAEIARLMELLDDQHSAHLISVDGIGGVGKTTLVVEAAYRCLDASNHQNPQRIPTFEAILFISAKQNYLTAIGLLARLTSVRTLRDICREITQNLDLGEIISFPVIEQIQLIRQKLAQTKTLLIVDNLETIEDQQQVLSFLYDLPPTVKVIITTREQALFVPIRLDCLPLEHGLRLIEQESEEKGVYLTTAQSQQLFTGVNGVPAAMIYAIGQIAAGYLLEDVLAQIKQPDGDVARFCFAGAVNPLRGTPAHYLLMGLTLFVQPATKVALASVAFEEADPITCAHGLAKLQQLSLVWMQEGRYGLLELTREYAAAELAVHREIATQLRQRWVNWYLQFSEAYGGTNWKEWHIDDDCLEAEWENVCTVLEWCMSQGRYIEARTIWRQIKGYVHVRGYWDERLDWTAWFIEAGKQAGDWSFVVEVMSDRACTLIKMRTKSQQQEAEALLQEAWDLRHHQTIKFHLELATNMVILCILQNKLTQAEDWLHKEQKILEQASFPEQEQKEQQVHILYYQGQISFKAGNYQQARTIFQQALEQAAAAGWQRAITGIQNWLAEVEIKLGHLEEARRILELSLPMAKRHKDKRSIAFHQAAFATLEKLSGKLAEAKRFAKEAAEGFESLKMSSEAQEMHSLLSNLGSG